MRQLKQVLIAIGFIMLLHVVKHFLDHGSPSYFFFYNCISCYQLFVLLTIIIILLFQIPIGKARSPGRSLYLGGSVTIFFLLVMELVCGYLLNHPKAIPGAMRTMFRYYYSQFDLYTFQGDPNACKYDSTLFYTVRPGAHLLFANREYADSFVINAKGFRSGESENIAPTMIAVGDSYSMGLGVNEDQTYSFLLEKGMGIKTLNTGVSSYGTARESISLRYVDTSKAKYVIWQYCSNDANENKEYVEHHYQYTAGPSSYFKYLQDLNAWNVRYFPGKYVLTLIKLAFQPILRSDKKKNSPGNEITVRQQAINFLEIVRHSPINLATTKIVVFQLDAYQMSSAFPNALRSLLTEENYRSMSKNIIVADMSKLLKKDNYYVLDDHINASGHQVVANEVKKLLSQQEVTQH